VAIHRNQYFMIGVILLLVGFQLRIVDSYVLNEKATKFLAERTAGKNSSTTTLLAVAPAKLTNKVVRPPLWVGLCMMSVGAVLVLHALALKGP
jgi:hypothetical protein